MNKLLIILLTVFVVLCAISCTNVEDAQGDPSRGTDNAAVTLQENTTAEEGEAIDGSSGTKPTQSGNDAYDGTKNPATAPDTEFLGVDHSKFSYEDYINMTAQQQTSFIKSFSSLGDFTDWYNDVKAEYDKNNDRIDIGEGTIDLGDIFNN